MKKYRHLYVENSTRDYYLAVEILNGELTIEEVKGYKYCDFSMIEYWLKVLK